MDGPILSLEKNPSRPHYPRLIIVDHGRRAAPSTDPCLALGARGAHAVPPRRHRSKHQLAAAAASTTGVAHGESARIRTQCTPGVVLKRRCKQRSVSRNKPHNTAPSPPSGTQLDNHHPTAEIVSPSHVEGCAALYTVAASYHKWPREWTSHHRELHIRHRRLCMQAPASILRPPHTLCPASQRVLWAIICPFFFHRQPNAGSTLRQERRRQQQQQQFPQPALLPSQPTLSTWSRSAERIILSPVTVKASNRAICTACD